MKFVRDQARTWLRAIEADVRQYVTLLGSTSDPARLAVQLLEQAGGNVRRAMRLLNRLDAPERAALCDGARVWLNGIREGEIKPDAPSRFAPDSEAAACAARLLNANEGDVPNLPSPEGAELGRELARLVDVEEPRILARFPGSPPRCDDCAFRMGTGPNQCAPTLMDAIKCVVEGTPFYCHKGVKEESEPKRLCAGWAVLVKP